MSQNHALQQKKRLIKMTGLQELNQQLVDFLAAPEDFMAIMSFVMGLHGQAVLASDNPYALDIDGKKVTPVFTDLADLEAFKEKQSSAQEQNWVERKTLEVLEEVINNQLTGLVFNLKNEGDRSNTTIFQSSELIAFANHYTTLLNQLMGDDNLEAKLLDKKLLVPVFVHPNEDGSSDRLFPTMSDEKGTSFVPAFSNLNSFAKWYRHEQFGGRFKAANGVVVTWSLKEIKFPVDGENETSDSVGVVVDPFDQKHFQIKWEDIV